MPFRLSKGGNNVPVEVQRWQFFLHRQGLGSVAGRIDGRFGNNSFSATVAYQAQRGLPTTGALDDATLASAVADGYTALPDNHYADLSQGDWPQPPANLKSPSNAARNEALRCFVFTQLPEVNRSSREAIEIGASCDGQLANWESANIARFPIPTLGHVAEFPGFVRAHKAIGERVQALIAEWAEADLLHLLLSYAGGYNPRYIRGKSGLSPQGHGPIKSTEPVSLSNHAFGSAFDFNAPENPLKAIPRGVTEVGSVRELVPIAVRHGFYWGGWFSRRDGMHFEFADFDSL
jgi:hypothetical protein